MRKALLLYNPLSGRRHGRRLADVEAAASVLRAKGIEASSAPTQIAGDATAQGDTPQGGDDAGTDDATSATGPTSARPTRSRAMGSRG